MIIENNVLNKLHTANAQFFIFGAPEREDSGALL